MITTIKVQHDPGIMMQVSSKKRIPVSSGTTVIVVEGSENLGIMLSKGHDHYRVDDLHIAQLDPETLADLINLFHTLGKALGADMPALIRASRERLGPKYPP